MDEDSYKLKREKNNQSVKKCRENEKKKVEIATVKLDEFKKENKSLEDKYESLKKELGVLKSLFMQSSEQDPSALYEESKIIKNPIETILTEEPHCSKKLKSDDLQPTEIKAPDVISDNQEETQLQIPTISDPFELEILSTNFEFNPTLDNPFLSNK